MRTTFIYVLKDPETLEVRYVGKSDKPRERFRNHLKDSKKRKSYAHKWVGSLLARGIKPLLEILDEVVESEWESWEAAYILFFREQGCLLANGTGGGEGGATTLGSKRTPEQLARQRASWTPERRAAMSERQRGPCNHQFGRSLPGRAGKDNPMFGKSGDKNPFFGRTHSQELRERWSKSRRGISRTPESREKQRRTWAAKRDDHAS